MSIYFIRSVGGHGPIKIGETGDIGRRLAALSACSPYPLEVVAMLPGHPATEAALHRLFAAAHSHGEWFNPEPAVLAVVGFARGYTSAEPATPEEIARVVGEAGGWKLAHSPGPAPRRTAPVTASPAADRAAELREPKRPPWMWAALAPLVAGVPPLDLDGRRDAFVASLRAVDHMPIEAIAKHFGITRRSLYRARDWMREHAPDVLAALRPRKLDGGGDESPMLGGTT